MWLIRVEDKVLVNLLYEKRPKYAILSHRWGEADAEASFQDMHSFQMGSIMQNFEKVRQVCDQAAADSLKYVWIDTCCINKDSSAELSEAINSMYNWYEKAEVCYVFLADVDCEPEDENLETKIASSEWFQRGWTLQELIAPANVVFLNKYWVQLGTKSSLTSILHERTGIDPAILNGHEPLSNRSIAQRMSWASQRKTTRIEDMSYCLLGIFDVNMPMLYGEGQKAFFRLQEEIIKISDDHSLFAYSLPGPDQLTQSPRKSSSSTTARDQFYGLLADSPAAFEKCQHVTRSQARGGRTAYAMTNRGLSIELDAKLFAVDIYLVRLCCDDASMPAEGGVASKGPFNIGLFMTRLYEDDQFARIAVHQGVSRMRIDYADWDWDPKEALIGAAGKLKMNVPVRTKRPFDSTFDGHDPQRILVSDQGLRFNDNTDQWEHNQTSYWWQWNDDHNMIKFNAQRFYTDGLFGRGDIVLHPTLGPGKLKYVVITFDFESNPICFVLMNKAKEQSTTSPTTADFDWQLLSRKLRTSLSWSRWVGNGRCAIESKSHPGLWAVKGHHSSGIDIDLISTDLSEQAIHLRMKKSVVDQRELSGMLVWDVQFYPKKSTQFHKWALEETSFRDSHHFEL